MSWVTTHPEGAVLCLRLVPRASRDEVQGELDGTLKVRLKAPPVEGKANRALLLFLAKELDCTRKDISILSGETSRRKRILIKGLTPHQIRQRLL